MLKQLNQQGNKKGYHLQHPHLTANSSKLGHHKHSKGLTGEDGSERHHKKRRWKKPTQLKDCNSFPLSSSAVSTPRLMDVDGLFCKCPSSWQQMVFCFVAMAVFFVSSDRLAVTAVGNVS